MWAIKKQTARLKQLQAYIRTASGHELGSGDFFECCLRASFSKSYEFCVEAYAARRKPSAFFLIPTLRSICEDIIVLAYIARMRKRDRENLIRLMMHEQLETRLAAQSAFFTVVRPEQPVLTSTIDLKPLREAMRDIWRKYGWPNLNQSMPPVRQIAEKYHANFLATLYEYLYRLTSGTVHFNAQVLLRSGWGTPPTFQFSPRNFNAYYTAYARTYGVLLFCLYFEIFTQFLKVDRKTRNLVNAIREDLVLDPRWPEMVTFEEMNRKVPTGNQLIRLAIRVVDAKERRRRFLDLSKTAAQPSVVVDQRQAARR